MMYLQEKIRKLNPSGRLLATTTLKAEKNFVCPPRYFAFCQKDINKICTFFEATSSHKILKPYAIAVLVVLRWPYLRSSH